MEKCSTNSLWKMAGANSVQKNLPCDREERIHLKEISPSYYSRFVNPGPIGTTTVPGNNLIDPVANVLNPNLLRYPFLAPVIPTTGVLDSQQVTNDQYWDGTVANALTTPSAATIAAYVGQKYLTSLGIGELGATAQTALQNELDGFTTTIENDDGGNIKTITFGAGITPASITFPADSISVVRWEFTRNNPPALRVYVLSQTSSTTGLPIPNPPIPAIFPQGIIVETTGPSGNTFVGRTIVSTDPELVVTNGNGVAGNPSLNINLTGVGLIPGGVVQNMVDYLGQVYATNNAFSLTSVGTFTVTSTGGADASGPIDTFLVNTARDFIDGNYNTATATYTIPTDGIWEFGGNLLGTTDATVSGSLLLWTGIASSLLVIRETAGTQNFTWGFSYIGHFTAGTSLQLLGSAEQGTFTTTVDAGSTIFGRLIQPDS
jgi:hypothetical protein